MKADQYCSCNDSSTGVQTEMDTLGHWDVCTKCGLPIEDSYEYFSDEYLADVVIRDD